MTLAFLFLAYAIIAFAAHLVSCLMVGRRALKADLPTDDLPPVTIVRPISQADPYLLQTLASSFAVRGDTEIIFCAARESDPAVTVARALIAHHPQARLLTGDAPISQNPKLNNCVKGWHAAKHDVVVFVDSNVMLPEDYLSRMLGAWDDGCGMVTSPPAGERPENFWATVECAFLNTHQARWQMFADEIGMGFAQGKNLMFRKSILDPLGGIEALAREPAEDAAATRALRNAGYHIRLAPVPFPQPLGKRSSRQFWSRQVRWAKLRRATFPALYLPEILAGGALPVLAFAAGAALLGSSPWLAALAFVSIWIVTELALARTLNWPGGFRMALAIAVRDVMIPMVWIAGFTGNGFEWQGHRMSASRASPAPESP
ncbi:glycosyltransferase [Aestuariivirga sp.]|uniref:glycosyltransferase n=1 Tax=Aestuariivirga sp. TaxID=2650926 RepID=UPI0039E4EC1B